MNFFDSEILSEQEFLDEYWEKKPLLIKAAVPNISEYASAEELKELAMDKDFESRIVYNNERGISVTHGPLVAEDFNDTGWTLVTHNLNLLDDNFYQLQKKLNFLPDWLFDDVMATHSLDGATAGAHIDKYNVFILQGSGKRKWELQLEPNTEYIEGIDIKILKEFQADIEWTLKAGDMIYIPSSVAHRGTSIGESISYSLGLKSLEQEIISKAYFNDLVKAIDSEEYLKDKTTQPVKDPFSFDPTIINYFHTKVKEMVADKNQFSLWMTNYLSTPRTEIESGEVYLEEEILKLAKQTIIKKDVFTKVSSLKQVDKTVISINNNLYQLGDTSYQKVSKWFMGSPFEKINIDLKSLNNDEWPFLIDMFKNGTFFFDEE